MGTYLIILRMPRGVQFKTNYDIMISNRSYRDLDLPVRVRPSGQGSDRYPTDPTRPVDRCQSDPTGSVYGIYVIILTNKTDIIINCKMFQV